MTKTCRFVTLAVATVDAPASVGGKFPLMSHLASFALLIAEREGEGAWAFSLERHAIAAGDGEDALLKWATHVMPKAGTVLGWQLADRIIAPLLDAGTIGDPEIGRAFLDRLMTLVTMPSIDLAIHHGGAGAPDLASVCAEQGIVLTPLSAGEIESAWAFGDLPSLNAHVAREAIAVWQLWLAESNGKAMAASEAFASWLAGRTRP
ncbi:hypothetical protein [Sphingomonas sp. 10B4]|uniref:hypothetical protein n=1 Tax=Sphingomonas sp. 10B4 TaxID=3048575 RepID=UPI002AB464ED|nr:hypothetical protein [Sphingomonas sp. 10B4]MDY7524603.1 hypothetical protein [Sphingomonas sp. 10B4]MEB0282440.1 hypothetical protein [Sphingomonas sp. 10B4]